MESTFTESPPAEAPVSRNFLQWLAVAALIYALLLAVATIAAGFRMSAGERARELFDFASNPIAGLVVGTVAAAVIQSSSTVTSIIVGLVAGGLPVGIAVPMIMGANMGTTLTNTLVSLGHVRDGEAFKRAFAAATIHDFFNLISVFIFLPLEALFHPMERLAGVASGFFANTGPVTGVSFNPIKLATEPLIHSFQEGLRTLLPEITAGLLLIGLGIAMILFVVTAIGRLLKRLMIGRAKAIFHAAVGRGPLSGITSGTLITVLVQSSSTTTSLIVPLAATGVFSLRQIYPFTLGANIGTCITALMAATAITGSTADVAMQIALVHLIYNVLGVVVIYGVPFLRHLPIYCAEWLSRLTLTNKWYALAYIAGTFFVLPAAVLGISNWLD